MNIAMHAESHTGRSVYGRVLHEIMLGSVQPA